MKSNLEQHSDRDEATKLALLLLAKSKGHVPAEITRKLVAVANGRASVPADVLRVWRDILDI